jgi:multiple sugar transport system substrate-binding protein
VDYAKKLTVDKDGDGKTDQWGYVVIAKREEGLYMRLNPWFWGAGGNFLTPDGKRSALNTPQALEGFRFYTDLATIHKVSPPGAVDIGVQDARVLFANNKVAMMVGTAWDPAILDSINPNFKSKENLALAPMPAKARGEKPTSSAFIGMRVISAKTKYPEEAWKVFRYIYSQENQERWFRYMGLPSSIRTIRNSPMVADHQFAGPVARAADSHRVLYEPLIPEWLQIGDAVTTAVQETVAGTKPAERALQDAHRRVEQIMSR